MLKGKLVTACAGLWLLGGLGAAAAQQSPAVKSLELEAPRAYGYVIGDVFRHRVRLELDPRYRLETESLPARGKISRWLEVRSAVREASRSPGAAVYEIVLDYQVFNAAPEIRRVATPALPLALTGPDGPATATVPAWDFYVAPVVPPPGPDAPPLSPRPPRAPPPFAPGPLLARLALAAAIFAAALLSIAWLQWGACWLARANRPFARAYRDLKRLRRRAGASGYPQGLRRLHRAFNETAGRALFPAQLEAFHADHRCFDGLEASVAALYAESSVVFFSIRAPAPEAGENMSRLIGFCRELRERERRPA